VPQDKAEHEESVPTPSNDPQASGEDSMQLTELTVLCSGPMCQDTILGDVNAQTRFEITSKQSIDPPLSRGYTLGSGEDSMKLIGIDGILYTTVI
ncbi:hypothetical protein Tco_0041977, partial [Tanacetum coccineum]